MGTDKNIKLHIVTDIKNIQCHNNNNNTKWYNAFSQDVHHQAETRTCNEQESTSATVGEDEDRKQNPIQRQEKTLEKNQARTLRDFVSEWVAVGLVGWPATTTRYGMRSVNGLSSWTPCGGAGLTMCCNF